MENNWEELSKTLPEVNLDSVADKIRKQMVSAQELVNQYEYLRKESDIFSAEFVNFLSRENFYKGKVQGYKEALITLNLLKIAQEV